MQAHDGDAIMADDSLYGGGGDNAYDELEQTQATQQTQPASQPAAIDNHLWGFLHPCSPALERLDFWKSIPVYEIGRNRDGNRFVLPGFKVSNKHCKISWDGNEADNATVIVTDTSSNGTYVNGVKIGKNANKLLHDGNEIAFGSPTPQPNNVAEDYRYVFRLIAGGPAREGMHAVYEISHELGKGSFASVYRAMHRATGQWYAVKMIQVDKIKKSAMNGGGGDPDAKKAAAFAREISILESLSHPNICQLKETFFQENNINLVLELVEGGDLLEYILNKSGLSEDEAKPITYQICVALAYIHDKGIAHRDLKPENILLTRDNPPVVKVADFGLAKVVDSMTALRTMCGTPSYLAPEVVTQQQAEGYSHLVDSWSVGVIVFSMLTNSSPFIEDENSPDLRTRIAERHVDWSTLHHHNISPDGESFIRRLLDLRPHLRMTLADGRTHPWLAGYGEMRDPSLVATPSIESMAPGDQSYLEEEDGGYSYDNGDPVGQDFQQMELQPNGATINGNGVQRQGSRNLQRRSRVLADAAEEDGPKIMEPSDEMISNSQAQEYADENYAGPSTGNKRKPMDASLDPMPEDEEWNVVNRPLDDGVGTSRKKGKGASDLTTNPRSVRGTRAARGNSSDDDAAQKIRRSSRQTPQKTSRKS